MTVLRAVILAACAVIAASAQAAPNDGVPARLDRYLTEATARRDFNGTVLVARDGKILLEKGYGFADVARRTPNGPATRFRISSLTQTFTRVALLQLVAAHRLSLDRSVCAYVRPCPAAWRPLTLRLLLDHRSGLPIVLPHLGTRTLAAWIDRLRAQPLRASPGRVRDRGDGPQLLAAYIVERVSGRSWQDYVTARIVRPLGMASTELDRPDAPGRATPYFRAKGRRLEAPASFPPLSSPDVAYGLLSTVGDMFRLDRALHDGTLPAGESEATHFELGHGPHGTADGWYTAYVHDDEGVTILAFSNMGGYSISEVVDRLGLIAIGWPPARTTVAETLLDRYVGRYTWWDGYRKRLATVTIARGPGGTLRLTSDRFVAQRERNALRRLTLAPMSDDVFFAIGAALWWGYTVRFELGDTPAADSLVYAYHSETTPPRYKRAA